MNNRILLKIDVDCHLPLRSAMGCDSFAPRSDCLRNSLLSFRPLGSNVICRLKRLLPVLITPEGSWNLLRQDLTAVEEAEALKVLMTDQNYTHEQLAGIIGKLPASKSWSKVVTPVKTGVQCFCNALKFLDSGVHRNDDSWAFSAFDEVISLELLEFG